MPSVRLVGSALHCVVAADIVPCGSKEIVRGLVADQLQRRELVKIADLVAGLMTLMSISCDSWSM